MLVIAKRRNLFLSLMIVTALAFSFTGCQMTGTQKGAGAGAGIGAGLGAIVGALVGDAGAGAAIGAGVGALGGALIGDIMDDRGNKLTEDEKREARVQALEMKGKYDPDLYVLRITRDANNNIKVVPEVKPKETKELQFAN